MTQTFRVLLFLILITPLLSLFYMSYEHFNREIVSSFIQYFSTTFLYVSLTSITSVTIGFFSAWVISRYNFPFRNILQKLYIFPLIFPSYIMALIYSDLSSSIMNIWGLIFVTSLVSIPYVYMVMYSHISSISTSYIRTAKTFNISDIVFNTKIMIPMVTPGILMSLVIIIGDSLSEFGASYFYNVDTLMVYIYEQWFVLYNKEVATVISSITMVTIFVIFYFKYNIPNKIITNPLTTSQDMRENIEGFKSYVLTSVLFIPLIFSLFIPLFVLNEWFVYSFRQVDVIELMKVTFNTVSFATVISIISVFTSLLIIFFMKKSQLFRAVISMNYAIPGLILSIIFLNFFETSNTSIALALMMFVFVLKYNLLTTSTIEGSVNKIDEKLLHSSKSIGKNSFWFVKNVQVPMARGGIALGLLLVFIDTIRELPIMLTMRPYNFETLSTKIFYYYDSELMYQIAPYYFAMLLVSVPPILFLLHRLNNGRS